MKKLLQLVALPAAAGIIVLGLGLGGSNAHAATSSTVVCDAIPTVVPGNVPSFGNEAYSLIEIGGKVRLGARG